MWNKNTRPAGNFVVPRKWRRLFPTTYEAKCETWVKRREAPFLEKAMGRALIMACIQSRPPNPPTLASKKYICPRTDTESAAADTENIRTARPRGNAIPGGTAFCRPHGASKRIMHHSGNRKVHQPGNSPRKITRSSRNEASQPFLADSEVVGCHCVNYVITSLLMIL